MRNAHGRLDEQPVHLSFNAALSPLAPFVRKLWYARGRITYERDHILPNGAAVLLINLGSPHATTPPSWAGPPLVLRDAWVCGVQTRAIINEPLGETHIVGATFASSGAASFFAPPMSQISDGVVPLEQLWGRHAHELRERLFAAPTIRAKFQLLQHALVARLLPPPRNLARVDEALGVLTSPRPVSVAAAAKQVGLSSKHLISEFHRVIGVSPGKLARIERLHRLVNRLDARSPIPWAEAAAAYGWSDQAHLIRDFKNFSGFTPTEYIRRRTEIFGPQLDPAQDAIFVPSSAG